MEFLAGIIGPDLNGAGGGSHGLPWDHARQTQVKLVPKAYNSIILIF